MAKSNFIDRVEICCRSGKGGHGALHFKREKYKPKGGPDGGDGGKGGDIVLRGNKKRWTLLHLRHRRHIFAGNGENGGANNKTGANGETRVIELPLGTVVTDKKTGKKEAEITEDAQEITLLKGGEGGKGNRHFRSSVNQAPRKTTAGGPPQKAWKIFELKLLADVGLVGLPNAGKSTLLSVLSAAKPKIARYPFTTTTPNLGIVSYHEFKSFSIADIPGIMQGAHRGKGLGHQFLRHIERNAVLLFVVPVNSDDIVREYNILLEELRQYSAELLQKERLLVLSKADLIDEELAEEIAEKIPSVNYIFISSVSGEGLSALKDKLWALLNK